MGLDFNSGWDWHTANIVTGHWYSLEIYYKAGSGNNAEKSYWIDGNLIASSTTQTNTGIVPFAGVGFTTDSMPTGIVCLFDDVQLSIS